MSPIIRERVFEAEQVVARPVDEVFPFFAVPENLERITPPWLRFRLVARTTPDVREGTELTYRLRIHGIPVAWRSRIVEWDPHRRFVDLQVRGPYRLWHHTHTFAPHARGTLLGDRVRYRLPFGALGDLLGGASVARDVRRIFDYRREAIERLFG
jgi:hypothetical protein